MEGIELKNVQVPVSLRARLGSAPHVTINDDSNREITVTFTFSRIDISEDNYSIIASEEMRTFLKLNQEEKRFWEKYGLPRIHTFHQLNIEGGSFWAKDGLPLLPTFGCYVQIPFNCTWKTTIKKSEIEQIQGDIFVLPAQLNLADQVSEKLFFKFDREKYDTDDIFFPEEIYGETGPFEIDGYRILLIHVRPFRYYPKKKELYGFTEIKVKLQFEPIPDKKMQPPIFAGDNKRGFGNFLLNPRRDIEHRLGLPSQKVSDLADTSMTEFLIIHAPEHEAAAKKLARWKEKRGIYTEVISTATKNPGNTLPGIKNYIRNKRASYYSQLRYVLLFGHPKQIPTYKVESPFGGKKDTDFYYATPEEPGDKAIEENGFVFPWLAIGRIPVETTEEGEGIVDKIIQYENDPPQEAKHYQVVFAAHFEDLNHDGKAELAYMKTMEDIRVHMKRLGFQAERVYVSDAPHPEKYVDDTDVDHAVAKAIVNRQSAKTTLLQRTKEGRLIIAHRGHGDQRGWYNPPFVRQDLAQLHEPSPLPAVIFSINCRTGRFDSFKDSFAKKLLKMPGGASAVIAATHKSQTWLNNYLMKGLFDAMWGGVIPTFPSTVASYPMKNSRLGDILNYAKIYLPIKSEAKPYIKDHFEIYHVIGDPTMEMWQAAPGRVTLKADLKFDALSIVVQGQNGVALPACPMDSVITIWHGNNQLKRIQSPASYFTISLRNYDLLQSSEPLSIYFWAPGYRFEEASVSLQGQEFPQADVQA